MSAIITLEKQKHDQCMTEVNLVLQKYNLALSPSVKITLTGMQFSIDLVEVNKKVVPNG